MNKTSASRNLYFLMVFMKIYGNKLNVFIPVKRCCFLCVSCCSYYLKVIIKEGLKNSISNIQKSTS